MTIMGKQKTIFEATSDTFIIKPNLDRRALQAAKQLLAVELSEKMHISIAQADVLVRCSNFTSQKHKYSDYIALRDSAEDDARFL
jgi:hypothetical protein